MASLLRIEETVEFQAGVNASNVIKVTFPILDDDIGLEAIERIRVDLEILPGRNCRS